MWGVAKIFASGHSKGGFDRTPRTPPGSTGMRLEYNAKEIVCKEEIATG